jgi:hypothetical protein
VPSLPSPPPPPPPPPRTRQRFFAAGLLFHLTIGRDSDRDRFHLTAIVKLLYFTRNLAWAAHMGI